MKRLAIVVPCFNEEEALVDTDKVLNDLLKDLIKRKVVKSNSFILYVNDGSKDNTWEVIKKAYKDSKYVYGLNLAGNKGHQNALLAGLMQVKDEVDMTISIDADLQDDVGVIEEMVNKYYEGSDIVYGVRNDRTSDSGFKKFTAEAFYKMMNWLGAKTVYNSADFRLMSNRALDELSLYSEANLFLRGLSTELGFKTDYVYYKRNPRLKGESKYPFKKMLALAINGITSFSEKPLTLILYLSIFFTLISFIILIRSIPQFANHDFVAYWTLLIATIWLVCGILLLGLGIIGLYIGKIFIETKKRPRYYIESYLKQEDKKQTKQKEKVGE